MKMKVMVKGTQVCHWDHQISIENSQSSAFSVVTHFHSFLLLLLAYVFVYLLFSDERLCDAHIHLIEQQCRGQAWYILLRAHHDLWWEQVGLLNLDLLAPSGWLAGWPWVAGWRLARWRTGFVVVGQSADLLTTCMSAGRSGRQAGCLFCYFFHWLTDWEADW